MIRNPLLALIAISILSSTAHAAIKPQNGGADPRVKHVIYHEQDVTVVKGHYGYSTVVEFGADEAVETISIGDSVAWQVVNPQGHRNLLMMKPLQPNANTNMTVVTNKRMYSFELSSAVASSRTSEDLAFRLRFVYPDEEALALSRIGQGALAGINSVSRTITPDQWNFKYTFSGSKRSRPIRAFDDGQFTYLQFSKNERTPAIFAVDDKGNESLVNYHKKGEYIVVERLSRRFTLRDAQEVTCLFNEAFPVAEPNNPLSPAAQAKAKPASVLQRGNRRNKGLAKL